MKTDEAAIMSLKETHVYEFQKRIIPSINFMQSTVCVAPFSLGKRIPSPTNTKIPKETVKKIKSFKVLYLILLSYLKPFY